ncbi:MAG: adenylate kinase [bacterium]
MRIILLGMPGVGKGTQAKKICEALNIPQIAPGDILRKAVKSRTEIGLEAKAYMNSGKLVPDKVILGIIEDRLKAPDCERGYILDGFPRTVVQANALGLMLKKAGQEIKLVISLEVSPAEVVKRLSGRRVCSSCGRMYHIKFKPSQQEGICDKCGEALYQREDDQEKTIKKRLEQYREQTAPLISYYKGLGILEKVDARGEIEEIFKKITSLINPVSS